ncbi:MAG TPA: hypothetical protein VKA61_08380 [Sphingomicrobium sp.]|nr:hypothetical protein [Sphingomicrobium sp.]
MHHTSDISSNECITNLGATSTPLAGLETLGVMKERYIGAGVETTDLSPAIIEWGNPLRSIYDEKQSTKIIRADKDDFVA